MDAGSEFRIHTEKQQFDTTTVAYDQTYFGLPVWEASVAVHVKHDPYRVVSASSTRHPDRRQSGRRRRRLSASRTSTSRRWRRSSGSSQGRRRRSPSRSQGGGWSSTSTRPRSASPSRRHRRRRRSSSRTITRRCRFRRCRRRSSRTAITSRPSCTSSSGPASIRRSTGVRSSTWDRGRASRAAVRGRRERTRLPGEIRSPPRRAVRFRRREHAPEPEAHERSAPGAEPSVQRHAGPTGRNRHGVGRRVPGRRAPDRADRQRLRLRLAHERIRSGRMPTTTATGSSALWRAWASRYRRTSGPRPSRAQSTTAASVAPGT